MRARPISATAIPTQMDMQMHMLSAMFAPHDKITLMGMTNYQQRHMQMESKQISGVHHTQRHSWIVAFTSRN